MSEENKKVTIQSLIEKKDEIEENKKKNFEFFIPSLDGHVTIKKPGRGLITTASKMAQDGQEYESDLYLVYHSVVDPKLKDKELLNAYSVNVNKGYDVVEKLFTPREIGQLAQQIMNAGEGKVRLVDEVKNS